MVEMIIFCNTLQIPILFSLWQVAQCRGSTVISPKKKNASLYSGWMWEKRLADAPDSAEFVSQNSETPIRVLRFHTRVSC